MAGVKASRRKALLLGGVAPPLLLGGIPQQGSQLGVAAAADAPERSSPLVDVPMRRIRVPKGGFGRDYVIVPVTIQGKGPYEFMIDTGLTGELITPHLQGFLGNADEQNSVQGIRALGAGGAADVSQLVELRDAAIPSGKSGSLALPRPLHAVVMDFPQEHLDPEHDPVEGMLGQEALEQFDLDLDWDAGRLRLWAPGAAEQAARQAGLVEVPGAVLNETRLLGIRITAAEHPSQPMVGIVDCGASFSAVNWAGAKLLGLPSKDNKEAYSQKPQVYALGVDGRPLPLPTQSVSLTFAGNASKDLEGHVAFEPPPDSWRPWDAVDIAVGDLPVFSQALGDGVRPFAGPAVLIGLDVLCQRRVIVGARAPGDRRRRLFVGAQ